MQRVVPPLFFLLGVLACSSIPGPFPAEESIEPGTATSIDGVWREARGPVVLRIDRGRVIAAEGLSRYLLLRADPGRVVAQALVQRSSTDFEAMGLLMSESWRLRLDLEGEPELEILRPDDLKGLRLLPVDLASQSWFAAQIASPDIVGLAPVAAPPPTRREAAPTPPRPVYDFGRYYALVIGNDTYEELPRLETARRDAQAVASLLADRYGFEVDLIEDATQEDLLEGLRSMRQRLGPGDNLLIYYAGHGRLDEAVDEGYWLPVDASRDSETNWIANSTISVYFRAIQAKHILVVSDSCFSGQLARGMRVLDPTPESLRDLAERRARVVMTSGGLEPVLDSAGGRHSTFAAAFLEVLRQNEGVLDTSTLFERMQSPILLALPEKPVLADIRRAGHEGGDFLFVPTP